MEVGTKKKLTNFEETTVTYGLTERQKQETSLSNNYINPLLQSKFPGKKEEKCLKSCTTEKATGIRQQKSKK